MTGMSGTLTSSFKLKRTSYLAGALIFFGIVGPASAVPDPGQALEGRAAVIDGDTMEINGERIRLQGIDAPEVAQTCSKDSGKPWNCGLEASEV